MGEPEAGGTPRRKRFTTAADPRLPADVLSRLAAQFADGAAQEGEGRTAEGEQAAGPTMEVDREPGDGPDAADHASSG